MSTIYKRLRESNIEKWLLEAGPRFSCSSLTWPSLQWNNKVMQVVLLISHGKKSNPAPPTHLDDLFKSISSAWFNSEKPFLASQYIMCNKDFGEYVRMHYKQRFRVKDRVKRLLRNEVSVLINIRNINNISTVKHFLENLFISIESICKCKDNMKYFVWIDEQCIQEIVSLVD